MTKLVWFLLGCPALAFAAVQPVHEVYTAQVTATIFSAPQLGGTVHIDNTPAQAVPVFGTVFVDARSTISATILSAPQLSGTVHVDNTINQPVPVTSTGTGGFSLADQGKPQANTLPWPFTATGTGGWVGVSQLDPWELRFSSLTATVTGAADAGVTLTLAAAGAGLYHVITQIEILKYVTSVIIASATPVIITTTNLRSVDFNMRRVGAVADVEALLYAPTHPIRSNTANTDTTIVFPAVTGVKWVATVHYFTSLRP